MVRTAVEQMSAILGNLQTRLGNTAAAVGTNEAPNGQTSREDDQQSAYLQLYTEKCREYERLKLQYTTKCRDYEQLSDKYMQLNRTVSTRPEVMGGKQNTARQTAQPVRLQTFEDFEAVEESMMAPGSGSRGRRCGVTSPTNIARMRSDMAGAKHSRAPGIMDETPTKRARGAGGAGDALPRLLSSPLNTICWPLVQRKQREWRKPASPKAGAKEEAKYVTVPADKQPPLQRSGKQPALLSSQETQLDFSDLVLPIEEPELAELCPQSNHDSNSSSNRSKRGEEQKEMWHAAVKQDVIEGNKKVEDWVEKTREYVGCSEAKPKAAKHDTAQQNSAHLQRILAAVDDCEQCRAFYSVPGLVLPNRNPHSLCAHRSRTKKSKDGGARGSRDSAGPRSEQKRPTTPEHFWDIDYFPPIRTGGPEILRKSKQ
ncbi:hypothetical protein H4217_005304 [Coemansia sp. RSA 1939]|nr:hypothetical protein H4217_005304 [Coemansia sp. RSA 1939]KAJ2617109.1 hypothetical protein EV177_000715 [Coemansia sp. RSA 1804]